MGPPGLAHSESDEPSTVRKKIAPEKIS